MKKTITTMGLIAATAVSANAALLISGLGDPDGGTGDILELHATSAIADLSIYGLESVSNSSSTSGSQEVALPSISLNAGDFYYVTTDQTDFTQFIGSAADFQWTGLSINGNDSVLLYQSGVAVDRVLADADNTDIHGDGWISRNGGEGPNTTFTPSEWTATTNSLNSSNDSTNALSATPMPIGVYAVPEPSSTALFGLGGLALIMRRRK